jgi:hypothetical protein
MCLLIFFIQCDESSTTPDSPSNTNPVQYMYGDSLEVLFSIKDNLLNLKTEFNVGEDIICGISIMNNGNATIQGSMPNTGPLFCFDFIKSNILIDNSCTCVTSLSTLMSYNIEPGDSIMRYVPWFDPFSCKDTLEIGIYQVLPIQKIEFESGMLLELEAIDITIK